MNKYRLNQILEVLLFPVLDPNLGEKNADVLLLCYEAYHRFMQESRITTSNIADRERRNQEYRERQGELISYLIERNHGRVKSEDYIQMLCEFYYPLCEMERELERFRKNNQKPESANMEIISNYYIRNLSRISCTLITYRDGVAAVRQWKDKKSDNTVIDIFHSLPIYNKVQIWNLLCRITVPDIYIVIAAVENHLSLEALFEQQANVALADKLLVKSLQKGVAENHLHFNVGFDYEVRWLHYMDLDFIEKEEPKQENQYFYRRLEMALFRFIAASYLMEKDNKKDFPLWLGKNEKIPEKVKSIIEDLYQGRYSGELEANDRQQLYILYYNAKSKQAVYKCDYLLERIYAEFIEYKTSSEFLLLYQSYQYIKQNEIDTFFARVFLQYLRLKNDSFYKIFEQHVLPGLNYFQKKYNTSKQSMGSDILPVKDMMLEVFRSQAKVSYLKKLEIRIAPWVDETDLDHFSYTKSRKILLQQLYDQIYLIFSTYRRFILERAIGVKNAWYLMEKQEEQGNIDFNIKNRILAEIQKEQVKVPSLGIVFHFLKSEELENLSSDYCWRRVLETMTHRSSSRMNKRYFIRNIALALEEMRSTIPKLNEYIVGIDAASNENAMEPWMFAPAYRIIRSHMHTKPVMEVPNYQKRFQKIQNIGFTYHVGEDFRHIISGLRHIDEVLEEFGYKAGDRLGHALALGIDMKQWILDNEMVPIPLLEYMENLLWMWGINVNEDLGLSIRLEVLEDKILNIAQRIYEHSETITVKMLYSAYKKKFDLNHREIAERIMKGEEDPYTFCCSDITANKCYNGWTVDKILVTHYCPVFTERYAKIELSFVSMNDLMVYQKLQDYLIQKVEQMGIYIETNPTSNLSIGDFSQMSFHPIFYLNQKKNGIGHHALVTINSDDPMVFNTNVENELAYIYYAAENQGYTKSEILEWIDKIRQYGMDASFVQKEKTTEQIFIEIEEILNAIKHIEI